MSSSSTPPSAWPAWRQLQDRRQEAHDLLTPVYGWFMEGFDTADLKDAKALLEVLEHNSAST